MKRTASPNRATRPLVNDCKGGSTACIDHTLDFSMHCAIFWTSGPHPAYSAKSCACVRWVTQASCGSGGDQWPDERSLAKATTLTISPSLIGKVMRCYKNTSKRSGIVPTECKFLVSNEEDNTLYQVPTNTLAGSWPSQPNANLAISNLERDLDRQSCLWMQC